jgi:hypothetical protein
MLVSVVGFAGLVWATGMPSDRDREHMVWYKIEKKRKESKIRVGFANTQRRI